MAHVDPELLGAPLRERVVQSPPIDITKPYKASWLAKKTILITGGASGFGAGWAQKWAANNATLILGDVNVEAGDKLAREIRRETGNERVHFIYCDVTDWESQVNFFREAVKLSPHGGIDVVVPSAGIPLPEKLTQPPSDLMDSTSPKKPNLSVIDVNLTGVLYTCHLAFWYLPRNPGSEECSPDSDPETRARDRMILLVSSMAGLASVPTSPLYATSKHGLIGLFRCLKGQSFVHGVRVNVVCPYFIKTPIVPASGRLLLAGGGWGALEDVIDAGTRLVADSRILGRALAIGPKGRIIKTEVGDQVMDLPSAGPDGPETGIWEAYVDDFEMSDPFLRSFTSILNAVAGRRGWSGWVKDIVGVLFGGLASKVVDMLRRQ
jgi:NAD(P)-dependent dehydrogenase (short-subunit alcohol dehydrogenase family)